MSAIHRRLTGTLEVALPPAEAFRLFTPRGEEDWVDGWRPHFPADPVDDTEPGTVFETHAHGDDATWVVIAREVGRSISYARVTPGTRAGTVSVELEPTAGGSLVTVGYDLTALSDQGRAELDRFAETYPDFLRSWQAAIETWLAAQPWLPAAPSESGGPTSSGRARLTRCWTPPI